MVLKNINKDKKHHNVVGRRCTCLRHREHFVGRGFLFILQNKDFLQKAASAVSSSVRAG